MVDFQSRDTRRGLGGDDETEGEDENGGEGESGQGDGGKNTGEDEESANTAAASDTEAADATATPGAGVADAGGEATQNAGREAVSGVGSGAPEEAAGATGEPGSATGAGDQGAAPEQMTYALVTVGSPAGDIDPADAAVAAMDGAEARVVARRSVDASLGTVQSVVDSLADRPDVAAVVTFGGVGVGPDDVTPGAVESLFDKRMDGFGELYRVLAHERDGTAVVRARAIAGLVGSVPVFCLPGDPDAARHGVAGLVLAEAEAIVDEATDDDGPLDSA